MEQTPYRKADIYVQGKYAGVLYENDSGYSFTYDTAYLEGKDALPVSLTLPLRQESYEDTKLFSFFDGLIPEGWLLDIASRNWKIDRKDRFGLLLATCKDAIGDVSVCMRGDEPWK